MVRDGAATPAAAAAAWFGPTDPSQAVASLAALEAIGEADALPGRVRRAGRDRVVRLCGTRRRPG